MTTRKRPSCFLAAAALVSLLSSYAGAEGATGWRLPAVGGAWTGGVHTVYADRSEAGMADIYAGLSLLSEKELLSSSLGARRIGYRIGGVFPILTMLEAGIDIAGSSISARGGSDDMRTFGDIRLRAKYYKRIHGLGLTGFAGYNLFQGVQDQSTVADIASPLFGAGISYFGPDCKAPNPLRAHLNATYVYDRTVNFLDGTRTPNAFERFAWQMRDYTYVDAKLGVEYELPVVLLIAEYALEVPTNDVAGDWTLTHTFSPGFKFNPVAALGIVLSADIGVGGDANVAPAVPIYDIALGFTYRFKGDIGKPGAKSAPVETPTEPAPLADAPVESPAPAPGETPAPEAPLAPAPEPVAAPVEPPSADGAIVVDEPPPATTPPPSTPKPVPVEPKKNSTGPVNLDQFEE